MVGRTPEALPVGTSTSGFYGSRRGLFFVSLRPDGLDYSCSITASRPNDRHERQSAPLHLGLKALRISLDVLADKPAAERGVCGHLLTDVQIERDQAGVRRILKAHHGAMELRISLVISIAVRMLLT